MNTNYMLDTFIDISDDSLDTEPLAILKQIDILNNNISNLKDSANDLKKERDLFKNMSQEY